MSNLLQSAGRSGPLPESCHARLALGTRSGPQAAADPLGSSLPAPGALPWRSASLPPAWGASRVP
eukprot:11834947-Alexandrium_andersonii.AAC.1